MRLSHRLVAALLGASALADLLPWGRPWSWGLAGAVGLTAMLSLAALSLRQVRAAASRTTGLREQTVALLLIFGALVFLAAKILVWFRAQGGGNGALARVHLQYALAFYAMAGARLALGRLAVQHVLQRLELRPAQTIAAAFAWTILAGGLALSLPVSVTRLEAVSLLDALFTSTSAVTVTGLTVTDPGRDLTLFGQVVLLALIQIGGLGTMVAAASLGLLAGRRLHLRKARELQQAMDVDTVGSVRSRAIAMVVATIAIEATGAVLLWWCFRERGGGFFLGLFHAVSAFCNAGFSLFPDNLSSYVGHVRVNAIIASLIVAGGLGFGVLREVAASALCRACRRRAPRLSLQARIALSASGALLLGGTIGIALLEWSRSLAGLGGGTRVLAAAFHSVSARTAGFNSVDLGRMGPAALLLVMALMFVGGSPGGTAGGIKTTTAAACLFTLRGMLRGRDRVEVARRTLPADLLGKALALTGIAGLTLLVGTLALLATQPFDPLALAFEATSAFATTGLSTGITAKLGPFGKLVLMALMFAGRTGPLTLVFALAAARRPPPPVTFPEERIMIG